MKKKGDFPGFCLRCGRLTAVVVFVGGMWQMLCLPCAVEALRRRKAERRAAKDPGGGIRRGDRCDRCRSRRAIYTLRTAGGAIIQVCSVCIHPDEMHKTNLN